MAESGPGPGFSGRWPTGDSRPASAISARPAPHAVSSTSIPDCNRSSRPGASGRTWSKSAATTLSGLPERTFKRRFKAATGFSPVEYVQTLRIEESKQLLERTIMPVDEVGAAVNYEDTAFFRRLFKR